MEENPQILILTPFRNEDHSIPFYLQSLRNVGYPKNRIDVYWLENDSSDHTLQMLQKARSSMPFKSTTLESIKIYGPVKKKPPGEFVKDIPYGGGKRSHPWCVIWNEHFLPLVRSSDADYVLIWYADVILPPNVITEYLKVFRQKADAGWIGGRMYRRYPRHKELRSPIPIELASSKKVVEVTFTGHCELLLRDVLAKCTFWSASIGFPDVHTCLVKCLHDQGLKVYYQPSVFLKHISTDGEIHANKN